jgi:hypothetical protein
MYIIDVVIAVIESIIAAGRSAPHSKSSPCNEVIHDGVEEVTALFAKELDSWCRLPSGKRSLGLKVDTDKCIGAVGSTVQDVLYHVQQFDCVTIRDISIADCLLDPATVSAKRRVLESLTYVVAKVARNKQVSYVGMSTKGSTKYTQLGWNLKRLGVSRHNVEWMLTEYFH